MNKIWIIIKREYLSRVKNRMFLVTTILSPLLLVGLMFLPILALKFSEKEVYTIWVIDPSGQVADKLKSNSQFTFHKTEDELEKLKTQYQASRKDAILVIPSDLDKELFTSTLYASKPLGIEAQSDLNAQIRETIRKHRIVKAGLSEAQLEKASVKVEMNTKKISAEGEKETSSILAYIVAYAMSFLIYFMVILYGQFVFMGVLEEKTSRIVEVVVSSVRPLQLMIGKIVGIGAVGLTQIFVWAILVTTLMFAAAPLMGIAMQGTPQPASPAELSPQQMKMAENIAIAFGVLNWQTLALFLFYFLGGYLIYASLFAAIGAAVDQQSDAQQFTPIIIIPIIVPIMFLASTINNPAGGAAFWLSIIPFTSPISMVARAVSMEVPLWELALSMLLLVGGVVGMGWVSARIYRVGLLMYGKKPTFGELAKWIFVKT
jgi:ABC-2 type transport system permease protein